MRKLIVEEWLSLDGYAADKNGSLDFFAKHVREDYTTSARIDVLKTIDTILFGKKTYLQFSALWPERSIANDILAQKINTLTKLVVSGSLELAPWGKWPAATIVSKEPMSYIRKLKSQPGQDIILWGSVELAQSLMENSMVDEYHIHLCPVITGGGRAFFRKDDKKTDLLLFETHQMPSGITLLKYKTLAEKR